VFCSAVLIDESESLYTLPPAQNTAFSASGPAWLCEVFAAESEPLLTLPPARNTTSPPEPVAAESESLYALTKIKIDPTWETIPLP
jgi:hypothetical protein